MAMRISTARIALGCALLLGIVALQPAHAQLTWGQILTYQPPVESPTYSRERLAKTSADECFDGIGVDYPPINPDHTCSVGTPKANQAYVWGLTQAGLGDASFTGDPIWFGTVANPLCTPAAGVTSPEPQFHVSWVCEYGQSMLARRPVAPIPAAAADWRPPKAYSYNLATRTLTDRTPSDPNFATLTGARSGGSLGSAVFLAGPNLKSDVVFAAWDAASGQYKGSCRSTELRNIRRWIVVNGVLYAGAARRSGDGVILRWRGTVDQPFNGASSPSDYCGFEVVGVLPDLPAYLTSYDNQRLAVSVWSESYRDPGTGSSLPAARGQTPQTLSPSEVFTAGVYVGPPFDADGGYSSADASKRWTRIWAPTQYDPDRVVAAVSNPGAIAFWKGWLWFGTFHNTYGALTAHINCSLPACYGQPANQDEQLNLLFNVSRSASMWRARLVDGAPAQVELLYGETQLPALVPGTKTFQLMPTGWTPKYGPSGFGDPWLSYTWSVTAGANDLLFGFYDYRYVFDVQLGVFTPVPGVPVDPKRGYGADVWRFVDPEAPPQPEITAGLGNFANYGVRNMLRLDGGNDVILGTANGLSLDPAGGWELYLLKAPATLAGPGWAAPSTAARRR
jgi:hypothetical protein